MDSILIYSFNQVFIIFFLNLDLSSSLNSTNSCATNFYFFEIETLDSNFSISSYLPSCAQCHDPNCEICYDSSPSSCLSILIRMSSILLSSKLLLLFDMPRFLVTMGRILYTRRLFESPLSFDLFFHLFNSKRSKL